MCEDCVEADAERDRLELERQLVDLLEKYEAANSKLESAESRASTLEAALRGVHGVVLDDGYEVNVADLKGRLDEIADLHQPLELHGEILVDNCGRSKCGGCLGVWPCATDSLLHREP
jgi:hypothetical protein